MPRRHARHWTGLLLHRSRLAGLLVLAALAGACATPADKLDHLNRTLSAYERSIRWAQFDAAYGFHVWENGEQPAFPEYLKNIKVTSYDVEKRNFDQDAMTVTQSVVIRYYNTETSREKTLRDEQDWRYDKEKKRWLIHSPMPDFQ